MGKTKKVAFAEDCVEYERRKISYFHRGSRIYSPGRHACPSEDGWEDFIFSNEPDDQPEPSISLSGLHASLESKKSVGGNITSTDLAPTEDSDSDTESDGSESTVSSVTALVQGENDFRGLQPGPLIQTLAELEAELDTLSDDDMDEGGDDSTLEPLFHGLDTMPTGEDPLILMHETNRLDNKENAELKNAEDDKMEGIEHGKESTTSSLGRRTREDFDDGEPTCSERSATQVKRQRLESST